jgi:ATP-binding protein involved in chromosome partitioning
VLEGGEQGRPVVLGAPGSASGRAFSELAARLSAGCALSPALA